MKKKTPAPEHLKGEAATYWSLHYSALVDEGALDPKRDSESFGLLCQLYGILRATDPMGDSKEALRYVSILKQFQSMAKQFGMLPKDRRQAKSDENPFEKLQGDTR